LQKLLNHNIFAGNIKTKAMIKVLGIEFAVKNDILQARPLHKKQLCMLYGINDVRSLNLLLHKRPFINQILPLGYNPHKKSLLSKAIVEKIFEHLGVIRVEDVQILR
jgi:hypothetical protein